MAVLLYGVHKGGGAPGCCCSVYGAHEVGAAGRGCAGYRGSQREPAFGTGQVFEFNPLCDVFICESITLNAFTEGRGLEVQLALW